MRPQLHLMKILYCLVTTSILNLITSLVWLFCKQSSVFINVKLTRLYHSCICSNVNWNKTTTKSRPCQFWEWTRATAVRWVAWILSVDWTACLSLRSMVPAAVGSTSCRSFNWCRAGRSVANPGCCLGLHPSLVQARRWNASVGGADVRDGCEDGNQRLFTILDEVVDHAVLRRWSAIIGRSCHKSNFWCDKKIVAINTCLSRQNTFFVEIKVFLSRKKKKCLSRQKLYLWQLPPMIVLWLDEGDFPENVHIVCPSYNKIALF